MASSSKQSERGARPEGTRTKGAASSAQSPAERIVLLGGKLGNGMMLRLMQSGMLQAKLTVSRPDDIYEQEADRVADQVMRVPESAAGSQQPAVRQANGIIQTKPG